MKTPRLIALAAFLVHSLALLPGAVFAGPDSAPSMRDNKQIEPRAEYKKGAPLPLHTLEGTGGVLITPMAYLVNAGAPEGCLFSLPSVSATYVNANKKNITSVAITEVIAGRVELGFSANRFGLGSLPENVRNATGVQIDDDVYLFNFNARGVVLPENSFDLPLPSVVVGVHGKLNAGVDRIDKQLGGALGSIGYRRDYGVDFTVTASKTFPKAIFDRTLILTGGLRLSQASNLGYLGFGSVYNPTFEGNFAYNLTPWLWLAGEYRMKAANYTNIGSLIREEQDWFTVGLAFVPNDHFTATLGYGYFGNVLDTSEKAGIAVQTKWEF
ncbi:MAG: DUF3034 family protein [Candidatus Methylacidiphilales bacterium]|nr:DUF3034 family protein [Candidatus Methylacidiphilales bacterium]